MPDFPLNDLCGAGGRWDGIARCINSSIFLSHDMRRDTSIHIIMTGDPEPPKVLTIEGSSVKYLNPDERAAVALLRRTLEIPLTHDQGFRWINPGTYVRRLDLAGFLDLIDGDLYLLDEKGSDAHDPSKHREMMKIGRRRFYILSDDMDPTPDELELIRSRSISSISVGPRTLHADHAITVIHNILDRIENP